MARYIFFIRNPDGFDDLPTDEEKIAALIVNGKKCLEQIEPLMIGSLRITLIKDRDGAFYAAHIEGPDQECLQLKQQIEEMKLGKMLPEARHSQAGGCWGV